VNSDQGSQFLRMRLCSFTEQECKLRWIGMAPNGTICSSSACGSRWSTSSSICMPMIQPVK